MALEALTLFIQERLLAYDPNMDVSSGSAADNQIIQPILRRIGTDPFTVDLPTFVRQRLSEEFPQYNNGEGDAIVDAAIGPAQLLFEPLVREIKAVKQNLSLKDPAQLNVQEAESLGANYFATRKTGERARGVARLYFTSPKAKAVTPVNYATSDTGLRFTPNGTQSIRLEEMVFNAEGGLYYFDVNFVAERSGDEYNVDSRQIVSIDGVDDCVRVTNVRRFTGGVPEESTTEYVGRIGQSVSEKSLTGVRGIVATLTANFPDAVRVGVVGMGDPEMMRDIIRGGSLGPILYSGTQGRIVSDGKNTPFTTRVRLLDCDNLLNALPGVGFDKAYTLTIQGDSGVFADTEATYRDLDVVRVLSEDTLEVADSVLVISDSINRSWAIRRREIVVGHIPGGILEPNNVDGTLSIPADSVHIGGATDILLRAKTTESTTLTITATSDESPILVGVDMTVIEDTSSPGHYLFQETSLRWISTVSSSNTYDLGSDTWNALEEAPKQGWTIEIYDAPLAGTYTVYRTVHHANGVKLWVWPEPANTTGAHRWALIDDVDINLTEPKNIKLQGTDAGTVVGVPEIVFSSTPDVGSYGVEAGQILRILSGPDAGDYGITAMSSQHNKVIVTPTPKYTTAPLPYIIFQTNPTGGLQPPFTRVTRVEILDSSGQPVGVEVPYAKPLGAVASSFANQARGNYREYKEVKLGLVGVALPGSPPGVDVSSLTLKLVAASLGRDGLYLTTDVTLPTVTFEVGTTALVTVVNQINAAVGLTIAVVVDGNRLGILPYKGWAVYVDYDESTAFSDLFGTGSQATNQVLLETGSSWGKTFDPSYDLLEVLSGSQAGCYEIISNTSSTGRLHAYHNFNPEIRRVLRVGGRTIGKARVYFMNPTSVEFTADSRFVAAVDGIECTFVLDPESRTLRVPTPPDGTVPKDGVTNAGVLRLTSAGTDFISKGVRAEDLLEITYVPIYGAALADPVENLAYKKLVFDDGGELPRTITFTPDDPVGAPLDVGRQAVLDQINRVLGEGTATLTDADELRIEVTTELKLLAPGTDELVPGTVYANSFLGVALSSDEDNWSPNHGNQWRIDYAGANTLYLHATDAPEVITATEQQFRIYRSSMVRVGTTEMSECKSGNFYYVDVDLVSSGLGDRYAIPSGTTLSVSNARCDGYWLSTENSDLTFSSYEKPHMHISATINEVGTQDDHSVSTKLVGQNIQVSYDRSELVDSVQTFVSDETERVLNESILVKHLTPHYVDLDITYYGGPAADDLSGYVTAHIEGLYPSEQLVGDSLQQVIASRGATKVSSPIELRAVVHLSDRNVELHRSDSALSVTRLACFIPESVRLTRLP